MTGRPNPELEAVVFDLATGERCTSAERLAAIAAEELRNLHLGALWALLSVVLRGSELEQLAGSPDPQLVYRLTAAELERLYLLANHHPAIDAGHSPKSPPRSLPESRP